MTNEGQAARTVVLYDGDCALCTWLVEQVARLDREGGLEPLALQTPGALERWGITRAQAEAALHVVTPGGAVFRAGDALRVIVAELPWLWPAAYLWRIPGVSWLADRLYYLVADNRYRLSAWLGLEASCRTAVAHAFWLKVPNHS